MADALLPAPLLRTIDSVLGHVALLFTTAVLLAGAFPEPGWWPLAWVALAPMGVLVARSRRPWTLAWTAGAVFLLWWHVQLRWLIPVTVGGWIGLSLIMTAYTAGGVVVLHLIDRRLRLPMTLTLPMVWVAMEFLRGSFPQGGFGWFAIGHSQAPYLPGQGPGRIVQIADLFGEWTVSLLVCMTSGLIVDLVTRSAYRLTPAPGRRAPRRRLRGSMRAALFGWSMALSAAWFYGQMRLAETDWATQPGPAIAVIQTNVPQSNKNAPTPADDRRRWAEMVDLTRQVAAGEPRPALIAWPETMVPSAINPEAAGEYAMQAAHWRLTRWQDLDDRRRASLAQLADDWGAEPAQMPATLASWYEDKAAYAQGLVELAADLAIPLIVGAPTEAVLEGRANSAFLVHPSGAIARERYDKVHLVPFGEYIPWVRSSAWLMELFIHYLSPYAFDYSLTPGQQFTRFTVAGPGAAGDTFTFATPICFEDAVAAVCRSMVYDGGLKRADVLVNLTNDGWFAGTDQPLQHLQIATFRSIENRVPTARSVNTGVSGFIDSAGRVGPLVRVGGSHVDVAGAVAAVVRLDARRTVFGRVGRIPVGMLTLAVGMLAVLAVFRSRRKPDAAAEPAAGDGNP